MRPYRPAAAHFHPLLIRRSRCRLSSAPRYYFSRLKLCLSAAVDCCWFPPFAIRLKHTELCDLFRYYGLWMWFPELFKRVEEGGSPCANVSIPARAQNTSCYPVKTVGVYLRRCTVSTPVSIPSLCGHLKTPRCHSHTSPTVAKQLQ